MKKGSFGEYFSLNFFVDISAVEHLPTISAETAAATTIFSGYECPETVNR